MRVVFSCVGVNSLIDRGRGQGKRSPVAAAKPIVVSPARVTAFDALLRIGTSDAHSDDLLHGSRMTALSQADRNLTTALVLGVLRWQIALDARLLSLLSRPDEGLPEPVAVALRLGAFQLLYMERIPAHAAVGESVQLVREAGHAHAAGLVNAVLRKVTTLPAVRRPMVESLDAMAERLAHPYWLVNGWEQQYGRAAAEAICAFDQQEPTCPAIFANETEPLPVMDAGSRLVAELAVAAAPVGTNAVWDCCAAPGGKTLVLARRLPEAALLATDSSPRRTERLRQRVTAAVPEGWVEVVQADAAQLPESHGSFDLILCDVPCSGTGTLARNPEIRHRLSSGDLERQAERQKRLLGAALKRLRPGGRLVYSTCSLEVEECEEVVEAVLGRAEGLRRIPMDTALTELAGSGRLLAPLVGATRAGYLRTLPGQPLAADGFFAAVLERA